MLSDPEALRRELSATLSVTGREAAEDSMSSPPPEVNRALPFSEMELLPEVLPPYMLTPFGSVTATSTKVQLKPDIPLPVPFTSQLMEAFSTDPVSTAPRCEPKVTLATV